MPSESVEQVVERLANEWTYTTTKEGLRAAYLAGQQAERERCAKLLDAMALQYADKLGSEWAKEHLPHSKLLRDLAEIVRKGE